MLVFSTNEHASIIIERVSIGMSAFSLCTDSTSPKHGCWILKHVWTESKENCSPCKVADITKIAHANANREIKRHQYAKFALFAKKKVCEWRKCWIRKTGIPLHIYTKTTKQKMEKSQVGRWTISKFKSYMIPAIDCTLLWTKLAQALAQ